MKRVYGRLVRGITPGESWETRRKYTLFAFREIRGGYVDLLMLLRGGDDLTIMEERRSVAQRFDITRFT